MTTLDILEAKSRLPELVARARAGEQILLAQDGHAAVRLQPVTSETRAAPRLGIWDHLNLDLPADAFIGPDRELEQFMDTSFDPGAR